jgi:hypothetical protein
MAGHGSLHAEGRIGDKSYLVTIYTGAPMTNARPDIKAGLSKQGEEPLSMEAVKGIRTVKSRYETTENREHSASRSEL